MPSSRTEEPHGSTALNWFIKPFITLLVELVELLFLWTLQSLNLRPLPTVPSRSIEYWHTSVSGLFRNSRRSTRSTIEVRLPIDSYPTEEQNPVHKPIEDPPSVAHTTNGDLFGNDELSSWNDVLVRLNDTDWEPQELSSSDEMYRSRIHTGFGLEHVPRTPFIWHNGTDTIAALCKDGVYGFGIDFDHGYLISETKEGALKFMLNPGSRPKGPTRKGWGTYDVTAEDVFGDKFGEDSDEEDESGFYVYDSGIDGCYNSDSDVYR